MTPTRVLFVCTGNLCRSPMAEGICAAFAARAGCTEQFVIDSAGTHAFAGRSPEKFAVTAAAAYGADLTALRSRALIAADFDAFDRLIAMDLDQLDYLRATGPGSAAGKIELLLRYAPELRLLEVPDPYGCSLKYFHHVAKLIATAVEPLVTALATDPAGTSVDARRS